MVHRKGRFGRIVWVCGACLLCVAGGCGQDAGSAKDAEAQDDAGRDSALGDGTVEPPDGEIPSDAGTDAGPGPDASGDGGTVCTDLDQDGFGTGCPAGPDCDDSTALVRPGRDEIPWNGVDDDCDASTGDDLVFDLDRIRDPTTAQCALTNPRQVTVNLTTVDLWDVSYVSWESQGGELVPILIRGYVAKPASLSTDVPGVVVAHGLGGYAKEDHATSHAVRIGAVTLAYTGPGGGASDGATSEGTPAMTDDGYRLFDTIPDLRGSWFWAHAAAALRGLTCLESFAPVVDPDRLGITGFSAGSVVTLVTSGVDDRLVAGVALSGTGAWEVAVQAPAAWQNVLLVTAGLDSASPQWLALIDHLVTPAAMVGGAPTSQIMMVNGTTDEFFPVTAHMATYQAIPTARRTSFAGNFDHGCYGISGAESAATIEARAAIRSEGAQRMWFRHAFGTDAVYAYVPAEPTVPTLVPSTDPGTCFAACGLAAPCLYVSSTVDPGGSQLEVEEVTFWWSTDGALTWGHTPLDYDSGSGTADGCYAVGYDPSVTLHYVDVQYQTPALVRFPQERFSLSSEVFVPAGLVPAIRQMSTCLP